MQGNGRINQNGAVHGQQGNQIQIQHNDNGGPPQPGQLNNNGLGINVNGANLVGANLVGAHLAIANVAGARAYAAHLGVHVIHGHNSPAPQE